ncbi:MAG: phosphopyruvate hydratase [Candidatus Dojkabacteria bacterium]|nr:MAG: phosphopyruvate hydratase [Candidatus Dojkabacteria bacterium]
MNISNLRAREILDSRGIPTIETEITLEDGTKAKGAVPSGASTGTTEVLEMRDDDKARYFGDGVLNAVSKVETEIKTAIVGMNYDTQADLDNFLILLDGTLNKSKLGGNSILSVSMAFARAMAISTKQPLYQYFAKAYFGDEYESKFKIEMPQSMVLLMEGGKHGNWATDFQEYMVVPKKERFPKYSDVVRAGAEIFKATHDALLKRGYSATVGFEGAFAPHEIRSNTEAFEIMLEGVELAGYKVGEEIVLALDMAASEFYDRETGKYNLKREGLILSSEEWLEKQADWFRQYPIWSIEDTLFEEDWDTWVRLVDQFGSTMQIVGDDLLTTNVERIRKAITADAANAVLVKINQIGTITETIEAIKMAKSVGWGAVMSHRGGETNDDLIADLAIGTMSGQTKFGGPDRGERLAKYNRLTEIELGW